MGRIEVRDFDGDFEALEAMGREAWFEEYGEGSWPDLYQPAMARYLCEDIQDPRFLVAAYDGGKLVAFLANLPRTYRLNGQCYRGVVSDMLAVRPGYSGAGVYVIGESIRRNRDFDGDFALLTLEKNHRCARMLRRQKLPASKFCTLKTMVLLGHGIDFPKIVESERMSDWMARISRGVGACRPIAAPAVAGVARPYQPEDLPQALALAAGRSDRNRLLRVHNERTLAHQLHTENISFTIVYERAGALRGFANVILRDVVSPRGSVRWAWLEFLCWDDCNTREKRALLAAIRQACEPLGCIGILTWHAGIRASWPFLRAGFIPYPRLVDIMAWILNPQVSLHGIEEVSEQVI